MTTRSGKSVSTRVTSTAGRDAIRSMTRSERTVKTFCPETAAASAIAAAGRPAPTTWIVCTLKTPTRHAHRARTESASAPAVYRGACDRPADGLGAGAGVVRDTGRGFVWPLPRRARSRVRGGSVVGGASSLMRSCRPRRRDCGLREAGKDLRAELIHIARAHGDDELPRPRISYHLGERTVQRTCMEHG